MEPFIPKHLQFITSELKKLAGIYCCAYSCKNKPCSKKRGLCHTHYSRHLRITDPVYDRFRNFRANAIKRNKEFSITLLEFREWCQKTGYIIEKGKRGRRCTVDRIRNSQGYSIDNIQLMTIQANVKKYNDVDRHFTELPKNDPDYLPF